MKEQTVKLYRAMVVNGLRECTFNEYYQRTISLYYHGETIIGAYWDNDDSIWIDAIINSAFKPDLGVINTWLKSLTVCTDEIYARATNLYIRQWLRLAGFKKGADGVYRWSLYMI